MTDITATEILCSEHYKTGDRLMTMLARSPQMIHQETLRHRRIYIEDALRGDFDFSFSVSSSRAIPTQKQLEEARSPALRAAPVFWGSEQRGMVPGPEHNAMIPNTHWQEWSSDEFLTREELWSIQARQNADVAEAYMEAGYHKSIGNRVINHCLHTNALMSATTAGWMNFFGLRLDHAADPILRALAESCWRVWNESKPGKLSPGDWHLPFIDDQYDEEVGRVALASEGEVETTGPSDLQLDLSRKVSTACCAHLSYMSFETGSRKTVSQCVALHDKLVGSVPIHASPAEHQATPDCPKWNEHGFHDGQWQHPEQAGNLGPGWIQYRKLLPGEAVASLPEAYR